MKKDIQKRGDIDTLIHRFYEKAMDDPVIGHFFTKVIPLSLEMHLPIISEFWETVLLGSGNYRGNPIKKHIAIDKKEQLEAKHFLRWKTLFFETVDELFQGKKASEAKERVNLMEKLLLTKITNSREEGFIL